MRRGTALPLVLLVLAMVSALAVGGAFVARQIAASSHVILRGSQLGPRLEQGIVDAVIGWDSAARAQQPVGAVASLPTISTGSDITSTWVTRLSDSTFWLVSETSNGGRAIFRRRVGVLLRLSNSGPTLAPERAWGGLP